MPVSTDRTLIMFKKFFLKVIYYYIIKEEFHERNYCVDGEISRPCCGKDWSQKHLVALRDSFIGMLPATLAGALAAMISAIVTTFPSAIQQNDVGSNSILKISTRESLDTC